MFYCFPPAVSAFKPATIPELGVWVVVADIVNLCFSSKTDNGKQFTSFKV